MKTDETILKSKILKLDRAVPRYTSYPAATVFESNFSPSLYSEWLTALPDDSALSLYVHIPFCPKLCHYCGCFTHITTRYAPVEDYVHLLRREVAAKGKLLGKKHRVTHLHFGGGSPTMLSDADFTLLMNTFREFFIFTQDVEIAVEVDPRHMTEQLAKTYAKHGVNRISFGVQDFDEKVMRAVGRVQPFDVVYKAAEYLRDAGIADLNLDFIYGLPHQTLRSLKRSMDYALLLKPNRVALYGYAHVPWKKKNMRLIPDESLPDNSARYDLFHAGAEVLEEAGFHSIGIDHFVKETDGMAVAQQDGSLGRNFQGYTNISPDALIGFGVSSISQLPQGFAQNTTVAHAYQDAVLHDTFPIAKGYAFKGEDSLRKKIIDGLMCNLSANISGIKQDDIKEKLLPFIQDGLAILDDDGTLSINPKARTAVRIIASVFDEYLPAADVTQRHSMAI